MKFPSLPQKDGSVEETVLEILHYLRWITLTSVVGGILRKTANGMTLTIDPGDGTGVTTPATFCPFGEIISIPASDPPARGIRGGVIFCGDSTWNIDPQALDLTTAGVWLVSLEIDVEVNRDDDESIVLPGVKTGTKPTTWTQTPWTLGTDYPDNTPPVVETGLGTLIVPLGKLTITIPEGATTGRPTFERVGCGNITVTHCAGTLSHTRG